MPKTESPIEEMMWKEMERHFHNDVAIYLQSPMLGYRVDFLIEDANGDLRIVECDGMDFHEFARDQDRDTKILLQNRAMEIYRFRGCDIHHSLEACTAMLRTFAPSLFKIDAPNPSIEEKVANSNLLVGNIPAKPILRFTAKMSLDLSRAIAGTKTCSAIAKGEHGETILQVKSPYWNQPESGDKAEKMEFTL